MGDGKIQIDPSVALPVEETERRARIDKALAGCRQSLRGMMLTEAAVVVKNLAGDLADSAQEFAWKHWLEDTSQWMRELRNRANARGWKKPGLILPPDDAGIVRPG